MIKHIFVIFQIGLALVYSIRTFHLETTLYSPSEENKPMVQINKIPKHIHMHGYKTDIMMITNLRRSKEPTQWESKTWVLIACLTYLYLDMPEKNKTNKRLKDFQRKGVTYNEWPRF